MFRFSWLFFLCAKIVSGCDYHASNVSCGDVGMNITYSSTVQLVTKNETYYFPNSSDIFESGFFGSSISGSRVSLYGESHVKVTIDINYNDPDYTYGVLLFGLYNYTMDSCNFEVTISNGVYVSILYDNLKLIIEYDTHGYESSADDNHSSISVISKDTVDSGIVDPNWESISPYKVGFIFKQTNEDYTYCRKYVRPKSLTIDFEYSSNDTFSNNTYGIYTMGYLNMSCWRTSYTTTQVTSTTSSMSTSTMMTDDNGSNNNNTSTAETEENTVSTTTTIATTTMMADMNTTDEKITPSTSSSDAFKIEKKNGLIYNMVNFMVALWMGVYYH